MTTPTPSDRTDNPRRQPPLVDPYPAEPQPVVPATDTATYTATDSGAGVTSDSLQAWQSRRGEFGTFVRADVTGVAGSAGPSYVDQPGAGLVAPSLVLTDVFSASVKRLGHPRPHELCTSARLLSSAPHALPASPPPSRSRRRD